jgi:hypothetical protein
MEKPTFNEASLSDVRVIMTTMRVPVDSGEARRKMVGVQNYLL